MLQDFTALPPDEQTKVLAALPDGHPIKDFAKLPKDEQQKVLSFKLSDSDKAGLINPSDVSEQIKANPFRALQIPFEQMGKEAGARQQEIQAEANKGARPLTLGEEAKYAALGAGKDTANLVSGAVSPEGIGTGIAAAVAPEIVAPAMLAHGVYGAATAAPGAVKGNPDDVQKALLSGSEIAGGAAMGKNVLEGNTPVQEMLQYSHNRLRRLSGAMQTPAEAAQLPASASRIPALRVSNQDVINEAIAEGIDLTPAQTTKEPWAQTIQGVGEKTTLPAGRQLQDALQDAKFRFEQSVENFAKRADPFQLGGTKQMAGSHLQESTKMAMQAAKNDADAAYAQAAKDQQNLAVKNTGDLKTWIDGLRNVKQPGAAVARPEYQTPAVAKAMDDIADAPDRLGKNPSIQSMRNLRTEFWEKSQDYTGQIPDSARRLYSQATSKVDDMMMDAAKGTPFEQSFRDASAKWKAIQQKYNTQGTPLNRILSANDSQTALDNIIGRKHVEDIQALKNEGIDLGPLKNQVVQDIASKGFGIRGNTLAGYDHSFLNELFGPNATQELYTKSELARRLGVEVNPSGTGRINIARDELGWKPWNWVRGETAARASMPRNPSVFVGNKPTSPIHVLDLKNMGVNSLSAIPTSALIGERQQ